MSVKFVFRVPKHQAWVLFHQAYNLVLRCEEITFGRMGLTPQQHAVLMGIKHIRGPVTIKLVANWLDRNSNSISMIANNLEKAGLVKRVRDLQDRREVRLIITPEGNKMLEQTTRQGWTLIETLLDTFSEENIDILIRLMEELRINAFKKLNPKGTLQEVVTDDILHTSRFMKRSSTSI